MRKGKPDERTEAPERLITVLMAGVVVLLLLFLPKACGEPGAHFGGGDWCDENNCH
jgi:hypothetical protein